MAANNPAGKLVGGCWCEPKPSSRRRESAQIKSRKNQMSRTDVRGYRFIVPALTRHFQNLAENFLNVLVVLRRRPAEGVNHIKQERGVLAVEVVINCLLGFRRAGFARRAVHRQH